MSSAAPIDTASQRPATASGSASQNAAPAAADFIRLPLGAANLRALAPASGEASSALSPLVEFDKPLGVVQSHLGALCDHNGEPLRLVEAMMVADPATVPPATQTPFATVLRLLAEVPRLVEAAQRPEHLAEWRGALASATLGPLVFCRKRRCIFELLSPRDQRALQPAVAAGDNGTSDALPAELVSVDAAEPPVRYSSRGGPTALGASVALDQLVLDQRQVVAAGAARATADSAALVSLANQHACVTCSEQRRCYATDGYAFVSDRLTPVHFAASAVHVLPLGEWRLSEAAAIIGGADVGALAHAAQPAQVSGIRARAARSMQCSGPSRALAGEHSGRDLLEILRLRLALGAHALEQLDRVWRASGRPHLAWNQDAVRATWRPAGPGAAWGFTPLLRRIGLHPLRQVHEGVEMPFPPTGSDADWLAPEANDAARYFDQPRPATIFVRQAKARGAVADVSVLVEDFGIAWELVASGDLLLVDGGDWQMKLQPADSRNPDDGAGLPFVGQARGAIASIKPNGQYVGRTCRWYPRFGEALDLYALGVELCQALLGTDERSGAALRAQLRQERDELTAACLAVPRAQRAARGVAWLAERAENDAPGNLWTRRNLLHSRELRAAARLDGLAPPLWHAALHLVLRLVSWIPGYGYCEDRSQAAPRTPEGLLLPLIEMQGLIALLDDRIFVRAAPLEALSAALARKPGP